MAWPRPSHSLLIHRCRLLIAPTASPYYSHWLKLRGGNKGETEIKKAKEEWHVAELFLVSKLHSSWLWLNWTFRLKGRGVKYTYVVHHKIQSEYFICFQTKLWAKKPLKEKIIKQLHPHNPLALLPRPESTSLWWTMINLLLWIWVLDKDKLKKQLTTK